MAIAQDINASLGNNGADQSVGLTGLVQILVRHTWLILASLLVFVALAAAYLSVTERVFTASIEILLDPRDQKLLPNDVSQTGTGSDAALVESQLSVLTSDTVLGRVVDQLNLQQDSEWVRADDLKTYLESQANVSVDRAAATRLVAIDALRRSVTVRRAEKTYVMSVRTQSREAGKALRIADAVANAYIANQSTSAREVTRTANEALTQRLTTLRDDLRRAEDKLQSFRTQNGLAGTQGSLVSDQQLQELSLRLVQAQVRAAETKSRAEKMLALARAGALEGTSEALASPALSALKAQLAEARRKEAELFPSLGDNHPTLIEARSQIAKLQSLVGQESSRISQAAKADADVAQSQEAELRTTLANLKLTAQTVDTSLIGQRDLERDVQSARQIYEAFLNRAKETRERGLIETSNARAIAPAALVSRSPFPSRTLILALAIAGGLGVGAALAFFFAHAKNAITGPRQLRGVTGVDSLRVAGAGGNSVLSTLNPFKRASTKLDRVVASPELAVAVRALRNELRDTPMRRGERTLLCASADTTVDPAAVALTLAEAVAIGGERVLLIDADTLTNTLTTSLGQTGKPGVSDVLSGKSHINDAVVELKDRAIWVLSNGTSNGPRSPAQSAKLQQVISAAAAQFDYVVIVPGALLTDPDALSLASLTDQIILTAREHETTVESLQKAVRLLGRSQAKLRRTVLLTGASAFSS